MAIIRRPLILRYASRFLRSRIADKTRRQKFPDFERLDAAVLFCDISGFSHIAEELTRSNPHGVIDLANLLNIYVGAFVDIILKMGGDVVKFAGDSVYAIWPRNEHVDITTAAHVAVECGFRIRKTLRNFIYNNLKIDVRIGVGVGDLSLYYVGGVRDRRELVMAGEAMNQANAAGNIAKAGELVISRQVKENLLYYWSLQPRAYGHENGNGHRYLFKPFIYFTPHKSAVSRRINAADEVMLRSYIPRAVLVRMDEGLDPRSADIREVSVIFLKVTNFQTASEITLEEVQETMLLMQQCLYQFEGSLNRFGFDDKGAVLLAAFGLPPLFHDDDAMRAVQTAIKLEQQFRSLGKKCVIGIGTGPVFCGTVGSDTRSEYTMHGSIVNYTAGLMQASKTILCDETTYEKTRHKIDFDEVSPVKVKGRNEPIRAFSPVI